MKNIFLFIFRIFQSTFIFNERVKFFGLLALLFFTIENVAHSQCVSGDEVTVIYSSNGTESFTIPSGVTSIRVQVWGAGGRGGTQTSNGEGGGGGGGAYSESTITVTPGTTYTAFIGRGSDTEDDGQDSWLSTSSNSSNAVVLAKGGESVKNNDDKGGKEGKSNGIGAIRNKGGKGGKGKGNNGGGGGSSASPDGNGRNGEDGDDGSDGGVARAGGGNGGDGQENNNGNGDPGEEPGGGGGGATRDGSGTRTGGKGGNGQIILTYTCGSVVPPAGCSRYLDDGSVSGIVIIEFTADCTWDALEGLLEFEVLAIGGGGGGGVRSGGGGGGGGAIRARANIELITSSGLPGGTSFSIEIGEGGAGSTDQDDTGQDGGESRFDFGGNYEMIAGSGGGGGSDDNAAEDGNDGQASSLNTGTTGFSIVSGINFNGFGGGGGHDGAGGNGFRNGGNADKHSGAGGGGLSGNDGQDAPNDDDGGDGATGRRFSDFDITLDRFFGAGGGGGSRDDKIGFGGSSNSGGDGGIEDGNDATDGEDASTPGSGGGGSGHDENTNGGSGAKGVVFIRYETARILPIEYLYFNSNYNSQARTGELSWATAKEWENSHFEIERAVNNVKEWEAIAEVAGAGFSDSEVKYNYSDMMLPVGGGNIFYRLKQYDFDGEFTYSITKSIKVEPLPSTSKWKVFPNPITGNSFNIEVLDPSTYRDESLTLRVITPTGQFELIQTDQMQEMSTQVSNYFEGKASGVYTLEISWGEKREYHKLILRR
jgi:hypothetical protein